MNSALLRMEIRRKLRDRRTMMFALILPAIFFLTFSAGDQSKVAGLSVGPYVMISMATYGAMNALFTGGGLIAAERAIGWNRQLRIAGLPGRDYVVTKALMAYVTAVPGLIAVFLLGAAVKNVSLDAGTWIAAAISILLGLLPVAALGIAIGYSASRPATLQPIFGLGSALLALLGGMFYPADLFPRAMLDFVQLLPTYWSAEAGRAVLQGSWVGWHGTAVLAVWTLVFGALAMWMYQRDAIRPAAAGTT
jgi:ABC-2 type transport system permease protein